MELQLRKSEVFTMTLFLRLFLVFSVKNFVTSSPFRQYETLNLIASEFLHSAEYSENNYFHSIQNQKNETIIGRLPQDTFPLSYALRIIGPEDLHSKQFTYAGEVTMRIWVQKSTNKVVLHSAQLNILKIRISRYGLVLPCTFRPEPTNETLIITTESDYLMADNLYEIFINYTGTIYNYAQGFFQTCYTKGNVEKCFAATQLESINARKVFPCYDEPAKKAIFTIAIAAHSNQTVLSNMPLVNKSEPDPTIGNRVWNQFHSSYLMSPYLVAYFISDDYASISNKGRNYSVWARKNLIENGQHAFVEGQKLYEVMTEDTGIDLNLLKMDMVAFPKIHFAMENWGLITFAESLLLYNKKEYSTSMKQLTTAVMAHEISHHWFGNLVTMAWWDDLWLKEGVATYYQYFAAHKAETTWKMDQFFVIQVQHVALSVDGVRMCQAMNSPVNTKAELSQKYNQISYDKGGSVIRMMKHIISEKIFKLALNNYIKLASYLGGVATRHLLWKVIEKTMKEQGKTLVSSVNFTHMMEQWMTKCGFPLIIVNRTSNGMHANIQLSQMTYKSPAAKHEVPDTEWTVGITCTKQSVLNFKDTEPTLWSFGKQNISLKDKVASDEWILCNNQQTGYYRVMYDDVGYQLLMRQLHENPTIIHPLNKAQLIDDIFVFAVDRKITFRFLFDLLANYLIKENDEIPWLVALRKLWQLEKQHAATSVAQPLQSFIKNCLKNMYKTVSFNEKQTDSHPTRIFRSEMVKVACHYGYRNCLSRAEEEYRQSKTSSDINPDVKFAVFCTMLRSNISHEVFDKIWDLSKTSNVPEERNLAYSTPSCVNSKILLKKYWYKILENPKIDLHPIISSMASSVTGVTTVLECIGDILANFSKYERGQEILLFSIESVKWAGASHEHIKLLEALKINSTKLNKTSWLTKSLDEAKQQVIDTKRLNDERALEIADGLGISITTEAPTTRRPSAAISLTPAIIIYVLVFITSLKNINIFKFLVL